MTGFDREGQKRLLKLPSNKGKKQKPKQDGPRKLKFAEKKELESLPARIEELELKIDDFHTSMAAPDYYQQPAEELAKNKSELDALNSELQSAYQRWEELELLNG